MVAPWSKKVRKTPSARVSHDMTCRTRRRLSSCRSGGSTVPGYSRMSMERRQVLLAGGIGSGKSEVGRLLALLGACVIDADEVGHHVLEPGGESYVSVAAAFPGALMDGAIDRRVLAAEVFADPIRLRLLESLTHPAIRERIHRLVEACDSHVVVVEIPLISDFLGGGWVRVV